MMTKHQKALVYVLLAMLEPLGKELAVCVSKNEWPTKFALAATACGMIYAGLFVLKAWGSDSNPDPKPDDARLKTPDSRL